MKLKTFLLLGGLVLSQSGIPPLYASTKYEKVSLLSVCRERHYVALKVSRENSRKRSAPPIATAYVEDDVFYVSFSFLPKNASLRVVDAETGKTLFEGVVSGTSLLVPLERDSESFEIYIQ